MPDPTCANCGARATVATLLGTATDPYTDLCIDCFTELGLTMEPEPIAEGI